MNYIIGELDIKEVGKKIRIINSYEESRRDNEYIEYKKEYENEKEIKENCEIRINGKLIPFCYFYKFNKKGKYTILYIFKNNITRANDMFKECSSLTNINLNYFNINDVTDMSYMFDRCYSLTNVNLSYINIKKIPIMFRMFKGCSSLTSVDLYNFNANNIAYMSEMFRDCYNLTKINIDTTDKNILLKLFYN